MAGEALREIAARFSTVVDTAPLVALHGKVEGLKASLDGFRKALTAAFAVRTIHQFAQQFGDDAQRITYAAQDLKITTGAVQELGYAGELAGVSADGMVQAMTRLRDGLNGAATTGGGAAEAFWRLGIRTREVGTRQIKPLETILGEVTSRMDRIVSPVRRAMIATQLFGEAGRRLLPLLHDGAGGLQVFRDELAMLGGGISERAIDLGHKYSQELIRQKYATDALRSAIALTLMPVLTALTRGVTLIIVGLAKMVRTSSTAQVALALLGAAGIAAIGPLAARVLITVAPFLALFLVIEDIVTWLRGGRSVVGSFLDAFGGAGTSAAVLHTIHAALDDIGFAFERDKNGGIRFFNAISDAADATGRAIMAVFDSYTAWVDRMLDRIYGAINAVTRALGLGNVINISGQQGERGVPVGGGVTERQRLGGITSVGGTSERQALRGVERDIFASGTATPVLALHAVTGPVRDLTVALNAATSRTGVATVPSHGGDRRSAGDTHIQQRNAVTVNVTGAESPQETARVVQRRMTENSADLLARAHAARREIGG